MLTGLLNSKPFSLFSGKIRKIFQNVICWNFYPACYVLEATINTLTTSVLNGLPKFELHLITWCVFWYVSKRHPGGGMVSTPDVRTWGPAEFESCWQCNLACSGLYGALLYSAFFINIPSSWYELNNVERDLKWLVIVWNVLAGWQTVQTPRSKFFPFKVDPFYCPQS